VNCYLCQADGKNEELRPYGLKGSWVCYDCAFSTPELEEQTKQNFDAQFLAAASVNGFVEIEDRNGPVPFGGNNERLN